MFNPSNHLPHQLAYKVAQKNIFNFREWNVLGERFGFHWSLENINDWEILKEMIATQLSTAHIENLKLQAGGYNDRFDKYLVFSKGE